MRVGHVVAIVFVGFAITAACADFSSGQCTDTATCGDDASITIDGAPIGDSKPPLDVAYDSFIVPDGNVPDGDCNGGAEDCSNGIDDNCDGKIDCDDPVCQGAGYACAAAVPAGWTGPVALADVTSGSAPACASPYAKDSVDGNGALDAPPSTCGCTCGGSQNETCATTTTTLYSDACTTACETVHFAAGQCIDFSCSAEGAATPTFPTTGGTCQVNPTKTVPPATWGHTYRACDYTAPADTGGCTNGGACVAASTTGFSKSCIYQTGNVACPGAPYTVQTVVYGSMTDNRDCSQCVCAGPTGGACGALIDFYYGPGCTEIQTGLLGNPSLCLDCEAEGYPVASGMAEPTFSKSNGTCASTPTTNSTATGSASGASPVTVCCQP